MYCVARRTRDTERKSKATWIEKFQSMKSVGYTITLCVCSMHWLILSFFGEFCVATEQSEHALFAMCAFSKSISWHSWSPLLGTVMHIAHKFMSINDSQAYNIERRVKGERVSKWIIKKHGIIHMHWTTQFSIISHLVLQAIYVSKCVCVCLAGPMLAM